MIRSTTVIGVHRAGRTAVAADGQVTAGESTIVKSSARKVRRLSGGKVVCGFAGAVADAQALAERLELKLEGAAGGLRRAAVEFAKEWRTDKVLRHLNAMIIAGDREGILLISGDGNVIEPDDGVAGIGSGGPFALAAARALIKHTALDVESVATEALTIASEICVFTNNRLSMEIVE